MFPSARSEARVLVANSHAEAILLMMSEMKIPSSRFLLFCGVCDVATCDEFFAIFKVSVSVIVFYVRPSDANALRFC